MMPLQTTLYLKTPPQKSEGKKKLVDEKEKKKSLEDHCVGVYITHIYTFTHTAPLPLPSAYFIVKSNSISPPSRRATKNRQSPGREARRKTTERSQT